MLTAAQVQTARSSLGVTPPPTANPTDLSSKLASAWGTTTSTPAAPAATLGTQTAQDQVAGVQKIGSAISEGAQKLAATPTITPGGGTSIAQAAGAEAQKTGALLETGLGAASGAIQTLFAPISATIQKLSQAASDNPAVQSFAQSISPILDAVNTAGHPLNQWAQSNPDAAKNLADALNVGLTAVGGGMTGDVSGALKGATSDIVGGVKSGVNAVHDAISSTLESPTPQPTSVGGASLADQIRATLAKGNVDPRLQTSAARLSDPVKAYSDYATQAKQSMTDVKSDTPLATVGENIGNAYDNVIQTRRSVGAQMASELAKVKDTPVDISAPKAKFVDELSSGVGKMTSFDKQLIGQYNSELRALGNNPTAAQLDEFLSRVPNELNVTKAAKNITDVTNAERIIKGNLAQIRSSLTSQPGMEAYASARNSYSNLSNFLDEGSRYLGGKTQAGDYTRDASVAKSSAESILSGGKKDWLAKLESLTGYPALDDAVLAIQAMKDAGDTRGLSLFKSLSSGGGIPTPTGLFGKLLGWGASKAAGAIIGSPAEQTTAFLKNLKATAPK